ncbi:MAG: hypothetical protein GEV28_30730 [Actinophytocola sp.]|uniref:hypothetical protein n=1 Tax=Actinophytocola sp. TaxID=1872138 RepID=UPI00132873D3|nr:hypothetical protein [Actinophytocola sp.]MPZ84528.1 hypothetical protein [Actinophytocola sp.]
MTAQIEDLGSDEVGDVGDLEEPPEDPPADAAPREWFGVRRLVVVLVAVAVLVAGLGGWFLLRAGELSSSPAASNEALVNTGRTAEVSAAVSSALNRIFSYSYDRTEVTEQAAAEVLRGAARDTYDKLFAQVRELAPAQKLVLTTRVVSAAVQVLDGDRATLLVFLDQSATRADQDASSAAAAQLSVVAERDGDRWVITGLEPR